MTVGDSPDAPAGFQAYVSDKVRHLVVKSLEGVLAASAQMPARPDRRSAIANTVTHNMNP